jgi:2-methylcitrate dehydratase PrpD
MTESTANPLDTLIALVTRTRRHDLPAAVIERTSTFLLDTLGVGIAGVRAPRFAELLAQTRQWGGSDEAAILGTDARLPAPSTALVSGYQIHAQEFDAVYEPGVILPMAPLVAGVLAHLGRRRARGQVTRGADLATALGIGLEISCSLAGAARSAMKFFRPGPTGAFSALSAILSLEGADAGFARRAYGILYSQISGTMQAHEEGSMMLAMQMGFNARAAITAFDLAAAGFSGPERILDGRFGYFPLFETEGDLGGAIAAFGQPWKVTRLSHKPFPSGRVTHGMAHTMLRLKREEGLAPEQVKRVHIEFPPLGHRLVGRPAKSDMTPNYARLCAAYVGASALARGSAGLADFLPGAVTDPAVVALAKRTETGVFDWPDANAFFPQRITVVRADGRTTLHELPYAWGHPDMPLSVEDNLAKFADCLRFAGVDPDQAAARRLTELCADLDRLPDIAPLEDALAALKPAA